MDLKYTRMGNVLFVDFSKNNFKVIKVGFETVILDFGWFWLPCVFPTFST
jgi:hypothetical protein